MLYIFSQSLSPKIKSSKAVVGLECCLLSVVIHVVSTGDNQEANLRRPVSQTYQVSGECIAQRGSFTGSCSGISSEQTRLSGPFPEGKEAPV